MKYCPALTKLTHFLLNIRLVLQERSKQEMPHTNYHNFFVPYLRYAHGLFNLSVIILFIFQAFLGLKIRKIRKDGKAPDFKLIRRHRKFGPILAVTGVAGFFGGIGLVYFDEGHILEYPLHFFTGLTISCLIISTVLISKKIRGADSPWRNPHFFIGVSIICLLLFQAFLGIGVLF
jgi:hypothetical protein